MHAHTRDTCPGRWRLTVQEEFSASHQLDHFKGRCERLHGHNFGVSAVVEGDVLEADCEILMDFGDLRRLLRQVLDPLEHAHLNEAEVLADANPSSENLARYVFRALRALLPANVRLAEVSIDEKRGSRATYLED
jgi:6-pyruvoyltetrahydropterin/6-carboxytetrahydropterin synthase